ncbi:hypothetical protein CLOM_g7219 [Closterium sp. NIES-68]|nr:hypothetical protein CLOM_g7219 [Closterium sp. NIES-68]GJP79031.1 hypothetical protein CLOP_g9282 [Closterium sp. NIES-67]
MQDRLGASLFTLSCLCLLLSANLAAARDISRPSTPDSLAVRTSGSADVRSLESAAREAAAADAEAAEALKAYEDAKKVLERKKVDAEGIAAEVSEARSEAEGMKLEKISTDMDVTELAERACKRFEDLKRVDEVAEKAAAVAMEKRMAAAEAAGEAGKAARLAEASGTAEARLALVQAEAARAEAVRAAEEAKRIAEAARESAEELWEAYLQEETDLEVSTVDQETEKTYIEGLDSAAARLEEEYRKSVTAVKVAEAKVAELKGLAEGKVARAKAMRVALRKGGKGTSRDGMTATQ